MMELDIVQIVSQVGFPIAVAAYSLTRLERTVKQNTLVMQAVALKMGVYKQNDSESV